MTKPRATWIIWTKRREEAEWKQFITITPGPVSHSGRNHARNHARWIVDEFVASGVKRCRYRILPAGRRPIK